MGSESCLCHESIVNSIIIYAGTAFLAQLQAGLLIQAISDFHPEVPFYFPRICLKLCNLGGMKHSFFFQLGLLE